LARIDETDGSSHIEALELISDVLISVGEGSPADAFCSAATPRLAPAQQDSPNGPRV
jgi:hypothetical protein